MNVCSHVGVRMPPSKPLRGKENGSSPIEHRSEAPGGNGIAFCERGKDPAAWMCVSGGRNGEVKNGNGLIWDTAEEMTELTPEACHILFSAPMSPRLEMVRAQSHASGELTDLIT